METLKKLFPLFVGVKEKQVDFLVRSIIWYAVIVLVYFLVSSLLGVLLGPVAAWVLGIWGIVVGMYFTLGILLAVLCYFGIIQ